MVPNRCYRPNVCDPPPHPNPYVDTKPNVMVLEIWGFGGD